MSIHFTWEDKYCIGDDVIDAQHKGLFSLGNDISNSSSGRDIKPAVMRLFKYTREHFSNEEKMMGRAGFPLLAEHRTLHEDLITTLSEIASQPLETDDAIFRFKQFVYEWLINHIMKEDRKFIQFSQGQKQHVSDKPTGGNVQ